MPEYAAITNWPCLDLSCDADLYRLSKPLLLSTSILSEYLITTLTVVPTTSIVIVIATYRLFSQVLGVSSSTRLGAPVSPLVALGLGV